MRKVGFGFIELANQCVQFGEIWVQFLSSRFFVNFPGFLFRLVLSVLAVLVVIANTGKSSSIFVLSVPSGSILDMASAAWCLVPAQWTMSNQNSNNRSLQRASF